MVSAYHASGRSSYSTVVKNESLVNKETSKDNQLQELRNSSASGAIYISSNRKLAGLIPAGGLDF